MSHKIATVTIPIPYKGPGGVIHQNEVSFDLYKADGHYSLHPCLSADELRVANLPPELKFIMQNGKPISLRGKIDGNLHVIQDAVASLRARNELV